MTLRPTLSFLTCLFLNRLEVKFGVILGVILGASLSANAFGMKDTSGFLFRSLSFSAEENNQHFESLISSADKGDFNEANTSSDLLTTNVAADARIDVLTFARVLTNAAIINTRLDQLEPALVLLNKAIELVDSESPFHEDIYPLMMVKAQILKEQNKLVLATDLLRRAQHITHRNDGVYNEQQIAAVDLISEISTQQRKHLEADRQELFNLRIREHALGADSIELVPGLEKVGAHFRRRGIEMPFVYNAVFSESPALNRKDRADIFNQSLRHYDRALTIQEDSYGLNDLRLVNTLKSIATTRMAQISGRRYAEDALTRAVSIIASSPITDIPEHAVALIELADAYTINGSKKAAKTYLEAWNLLSQSQDFQALRTQVFDSTTQIFPSTRPYNLLVRRPSNVQPGEKIYVKAMYSVRPNGRASNINVIDSNAPVAQKKQLRLWIRESRFRPRIEDGVIVLTEGLTVSQTFHVVTKKVPQPSEEDQSAKLEEPENKET